MVIICFICLVLLELLDLVLECWLVLFDFFFIFFCGSFGSCCVCGWEWSVDGVGWGGLVGVILEEGFIGVENC